MTIGGGKLHGELEAWNKNQVFRKNYFNTK